MRSLLIAALVLAGASAASLNASAQGMTTAASKTTSATKTAAIRCKDAKGKFMKCPAPAAPAKPKQCRDAKGKFIKC